MGTTEGASVLITVNQGKFESLRNGIANFDIGWVLGCAGRSDYIGIYSNI